MNIFRIMIFLLFISGSLIKADLLPEGKKKISYGFTVTNTDSFPGYTFIAYPVNQSNGVPYLTANILNPDKALHLACRFGAPVIYAVRKENFNYSILDSINNISDDKERDLQLKKYFENKNFIPSVKVICNSFVDRDEKYDVIQENFRIESIEADTMIIKSQKLLYKDRNNNIIDAKDSRMKAKDDLVSPTQKYSNYLLIIIPVLALVSIVTIILIRKMKK
jgi:hypothetical protein